MYWWNSSPHILKTKCSLRRYTVLCEVVVKRAAEKSAIDEKIERDRLVVLENSVDEA